MRRIGVVVHSDDPVIRSGVTGFLRSRPELSLLDLPEGETPPEGSVVLLCVDSVNERVLGILREYCETENLQAVLMVGHILEPELLEALECGVRIVIRRQEASPDRLVRAIQMADSGGAELPPDLLGGLLGHIGFALRSGSDPKDMPPVSDLAPREIDVIRLISEGLDTREIAERLCYSERTIKGVIQSLMTRLKLRNRAHAVAYAGRKGYLW